MGDLMVSLNWTNTSVLCLEDETMSKPTKTILSSSLALAAAMVLFTGCLNVPAQLNNFSSEVNPLPFPTVQRLVKDAVATSHEPDSVGILSFSPDAKWYDVTLGYVCFTPIAVVACGVALVSDALFLPYNLPASMFLHEDGYLTIEQAEDTRLKWQGNVYQYAVRGEHDHKLIVEVERGTLTLSIEGSTSEDMVFNKPGRYNVRVFAPYISFDEFFSPGRKLIGLDDLRSLSECRAVDDNTWIVYRPLAATIKTGTCVIIKKSPDFAGRFFLTQIHTPRPVSIQPFQLSGEEISNGEVSYTSPRFEKPIAFSLKEMRLWDSRCKRMVEDWFAHIHERLCEGLPEDCSRPDKMSDAVIIDLKQLKVYLSAGVVIIEDRRSEKDLRLYHRSRLIDLDRNVYAELIFEEVEKSFKFQDPPVASERR